MWGADTVGALKQILAPFSDECRINSVVVEYKKEPNRNARLIIKLITGNINSMEQFQKKYFPNSVGKKCPYCGVDLKRSDGITQ